MEDEHVLSSLTRKRAEIAGQIEHTQDALRKLVIEAEATGRFGEKEGLQCLDIDIYRI